LPYINRHFRREVSRPMHERSRYFKPSC
jgi:hypothetical protein